MVFQAAVAISECRGSRGATYVVRMIQHVLPARCVVLAEILFRLFARCFRLQVDPLRRGMRVSNEDVGDC